MIDSSVLTALISAASGIAIAYIINVIAKRRRPKDRQETIFDGYERLIKQQQFDIDRKELQLNQTQLIIEQLQRQLDQTKLIVERQQGELTESRDSNRELVRQLADMRREHHSNA